MFPLALTLFLLVICPRALSVFGLGTEQSTAVRGILQCHGKPMNGTKVKLYDEDLADPDDLMDEGVTNEGGHFELQGKETELGQIEPKLNIYHHCNDEESINPLKSLCYKKISIRIPSEYITNGEMPKRTYDAGVLNLAGSFAGESRDCLN